MITDTGAIELQIISKILTTDDPQELDTLCSFDDTYYNILKDQINFILDHKFKYDVVPDRFTFMAQFPDITLVSVNEPLEYLTAAIKQNKQLIIIRETFEKVSKLNFNTANDVINYIDAQMDSAKQLDAARPMDIVHDAYERSQQVLKYSQQTRIPTGFPEIDKLMYGGLSTVEEFLIILARTNTGKSWICTKMMESAQKNGFPCLYYSPEMQASLLATRFDTWRMHFKNSQLFQGNYTEEYHEYIKNLTKEETPAFILEDKDAASGMVSVPVIERLVRQFGIKLVIVDGMSYVEDSRSKYGDNDVIKYKNVSNDLFRLSKKYGCAVVVALQANRETKDMKDEKGTPMPSLYNIESSDHPARIATQVFAVRQIFETHTLDIRLEKSRMANNQKPMFSYSWDVNTGTMAIATEGNTAPDQEISSGVNPISFNNGNVTHHTDEKVLNDSEFEDDDADFGDVDF